MEMTREGWMVPREEATGDGAGCDAARRPPGRQTCNLGDCSARFYWVTEAWGEVNIVGLERVCGCNPNDSVCSTSS